MNTPKAYLYSRVSNEKQIKGDGLDFQNDQGFAYYHRELAPRGLPLDNSIRSDKGRSAFKGAHLKEDGALRKILDEIAVGTIVPGSVLIVQNLDRISRQGNKLARQTLAAITDHDVQIHIVNLNQILKRNWENDPAHFYAVDGELQRAWRESLCKSERVGAAWNRKRNNIMPGQVLTSIAPAWLEVVDGKYQPVTEPKKIHNQIKVPVPVVQDMFRLAAGGVGAGNIAARLNGRLNGLSISWVSSTLADRSVLGEFNNSRETIQLYPKVVDQSVFDAARASIKSRLRNAKMRCKGGRGVGNERVSLFSGLVFDVTDGPARAMHYQFNIRNGKPTGEYLRTARTTDGRTPNIMPCARLEHSILLFLDEADWAHIAADSDSDGCRKAVADLEPVLTAIDKTTQRIATTNAALDDERDVATIKVLAGRIAKDEAALVTLCSQKSALQDRIEAERAKLAALYRPEQLLDLIHQAETSRDYDFRLRLKSEICRRVSAIHIQFEDRKPRQAIIRLINGYTDVILFARTASGG